MQKYFAQPIYTTFIKNDLWIELAKQSNKMAKYLANKLVEKGYRIYYPCQTNMVFVVITPEKLAILQEKYDMHYGMSLNTFCALQLRIKQQPNKSISC